MATEYIWSNRNKLPSGRWGVFLYCPGQGFDAGNRVYYGREEWNTEEQANAYQEAWESRWQQFRQEWPYILKTGFLSIEAERTTLNELKS